MLTGEVKGARPTRSPNGKRWPLVVAAVVALSVIAVAARIGYLVVEDANQPQARPAPEAGTPTRTTEPPPPRPGAPVPCDPARPVFGECFPPDYDPDAVLDRVAAQGWHCLRKGEMDEVGSPVFEPRKCEVEDNVGQPYTIRASISYQTHDFKPSGKLRSFELYATTSAVAHRGEHTSREDAIKAVITAYRITGEHIWQGHPEQAREAAAVFEEITPRCYSPQAGTLNGASVRTASGFEITCSGSAGVASGDVVTYGQSLQIKPA